MSWIAALVNTYNNSSQLWGKHEEGDAPGTIPLLLVGQSTQNAQVEVRLDAQANIIGAYAITEKAEQVTVIPCTEGSIGRVGVKLAPHPLHDKLQYVAGDYAAFGGEKAPGCALYMEQLNEWCAPEYAHPKVKVIRDYLKRGCLIADLVDHGLVPAHDGKIIRKPDQDMKDKYPLFRSHIADPMEAFVRFTVTLPGDATEPWRDPSINDSFNAWQNTLKQDEGLCFASGQQGPLSKNHPAKLRHTGDKAKLISANDTSGFTYRGRFLDEKQVVGVAYETTQKAHNMLKWLISRQGFRNDTQVFVAWGTNLQPLPAMADDTDDLCGVVSDEPVPEDEYLSAQNLRREYASRFRKAMAGYQGKIADTDGVVVLGVDSATTGRMSIIFYRELTGSDFLGRIETWHSHCSWLHEYKNKDKKRIRFVGAPAPRDIVEAAYGIQVADKLKKATIETLLHCIVDGKPIPPGLRQSLVRRAGNPVAMENWEWRKTLSIACAVVRKNLIEERGGEWPMTVDNSITDRSYLFGRLLAYAQHIENRSQYIAEKAQRETNAERMMHQFRLRPAKTWDALRLRLQSYLRQLRNQATVNWWQTETDAIMRMLGTEGFTNQPLDEQYLLGYSSQMMALREKKKDTQNEEDNRHDTKE